LTTLRLLLLALLFCGITVLSVIVYRVECNKRQAKEDLIELSRVKYGLFSVDEWKGLLATIVTRKLEAFDLDGADKEEMRRRISEFLSKFLNDFEKQYYEEKSRSLGGLIQSGIASLTGTVEKMKKDVPVITERILEFMNDPRNRDAIRTYIIEKLDEYADETFSEIDYTLHDQIIATHGYETRSATITALQGDIQDTQQKQRPFVIALFILIGICGIMLLTSKQLSQAEVIGYIALCFILLLAGLLLPMIEIDARISDLKFSFLGESISFTDQVLYYKSKSILEVVHLMVTQSRVDLLLVGMLVLAFSVLFPIAKLICSVIFVFHKRMRENRLIRFIVFKTGKWSMADVMVVAIFMAYIGFSGIIGEQLAQLQRITDNLEILTTNQSCLLIGFYLFTSFAVLSLLVSHKMQYGRG
jgi:hypothetical protein